MEKVKLNKDVAEKLEFLRKRIIDQKYLFFKVFDDASENTIVNFVNLPAEYQKGIDEKIDELFQFVSQHPELYYSALINGYEVETTPEDNLYAVFKNYENLGLQSWNPATREKHHMVCLGIKLAVDSLGLKIKGVNE